MQTKLKIQAAQKSPASVAFEDLKTGDFFRRSGTRRTELCRVISTIQADQARLREDVMTGLTASTHPHTRCILIPEVTIIVGDPTTPAGDKELPGVL